MEDGTNSYLSAAAGDAVKDGLAMAAAGFAVAGPGGFAGGLALGAFKGVAGTGVESFVDNYHQTDSFVQAGRDTVTGLKTEMRNTVSSVRETYEGIASSDNSDFKYD
jgi:hypothetical protein